MMGRECFIYTYNHETSRTDIPMQEQGKSVEKAVCIGDEVWIGPNAVIVGNIKIGNNVLIAPNAYVNFDVPENSVVIGNPAQITTNLNATQGYINHKI